MLSEFIQNRIQYVDTLKYLKEGWISGGAGEGAALVPSDKSREIAKKMLYTIEEQALNMPSCLVENIKSCLLMCPLPEGGVAIEIHLKPNQFTIFEIKNDEMIEIQKLDKDVFTERLISISELDFKKELLNACCKNFA